MYLKLVSLIKIISLSLAKDFIYNIFRRKRRLIESVILVKYNTSKFFGFGFLGSSWTGERLSDQGAK